MDVGRICVKTAGRDSGKYCVIINKIDENTVLIDGQTRKKKCNTKHLEPTKKTIKITQNTTNQQILQELTKNGIKNKPTKKRTTPKTKTQKPTKKRYQKQKNTTEQQKTKSKPKKEGQKEITQNKQQEQTNQNS